MMHARPAVITPRYCALVFNAYDWNRREIMCVQPRVVKAHSDVADLSHPRGWPRARPPVREVPAVCRYPQVSAVNRVRCGVPRHEPGRESATRQLLLLLPATDARAHIDRTARVHDKFIFRELRRSVGRSAPIGFCAACDYQSPTCTVLHRYYWNQFPKPFSKQPKLDSVD